MDNVEVINEKNKELFEELQKLSAEAQSLHVSMMIKNIIAVILSPIAENEKALHQVLELMNIDLNALGYAIVKTTEEKDADE